MMATPSTPIDLSAALAGARPDEAVLMVLPTDFGAHVIAISATDMDWNVSEFTQPMIDLAVKRLRWDLGASVDVSPKEEEEWLAEGEAPGQFQVERECELKSSAEDRAVVKYTRHTLDIDEVKQHIAQGKLPTKLALNWQGRVAFTLTEAMTLKKVGLLETVFEGTSKEKEDNFDADVAISTGELGQLIPELVEALGGELLEFGTANTTPAAHPEAAPASAAGTVTTGRAHQATAADLATADDGSAPF